MNYRGRTQTVEVFKGYNLSEETFQDLDKFLIMKERYLNDKSIDNRVNMKMAYEDVFIDIKSAWVSRQITRLDFLNLDELLKEGL